MLPPLLADVLDALPNIVFMKDAGHHCLFVNKQWCEYVGLRREDVLGKTDWEFIPKAEADVFCAVDDIVFGTGQTWENEEFFTSAQGERRLFITRKILHVDAQGERVLLGVSTDITERKAGEEALRRGRDELERLVAERTARLRESEERYRAVFETTGAANVLLYDTGVIELANEAFATLVGVPRAQLEGRRTLLDFTEQPAALEAQLRLRGDEPRSFEVRLVRRDCIANLSVIPGRRERMVSLVDVTERKRVSEELFRAEKMSALGQIMAGVAHEINNPNNFVYFNLPILRRYIDALRPLVDPSIELLGMPAPAFLEDVDRLIDNMQHGSQRITAIVGELKSYIRSQESDERRPGRLEDVIERVMTLVGKQVRKMVKRLEVDVQAPLPKVVMNGGRIEQVLINLLLNAGQAADKEDSLVRLAARAKDGKIEIVVSDNGSGIAPDLLGRIFDPFFTTKERDGGTGLGLAIVQRIVNEHGGAVAVASTQGQGAAFTVTLRGEPP